MSSPLTRKDPPKSKPTRRRITAKKQIVSDPGICLALSILWTEEEGPILPIPINQIEHMEVEIRLRSNLEIQEKQEVFKSSYTITCNTGTFNFDQDFIFLVPFIDPAYQDGQPLSLYLKVKFIGSDETELWAPEFLEAPIGENIKIANQISFYSDGGPIRTQNTVRIYNDLASCHDFWFHELGMTFSTDLCIPMTKLPQDTKVEFSFSYADFTYTVILYPNHKTTKSTQELEVNCLFWIPFIQSNGAQTSIELTFSLIPPNGLPVDSSPPVARTVPIDSLNQGELVLTPNAFLSQSDA